MERQNTHSRRRDGVRIPLGFARWDASRAALGIAGTSVLGFLYLPIIVLVVFSFNSNPITRLPLTEWTWHWYETALSNKLLLTALANSMIVGAGAVAICLVIGVPTAFALDRYNFPGEALLRRFVILPLTLPGLITGVSMLAFFNMLGISLSLVTVLIGHGTALTAIVVTNVFARLQRYDRRIEEASADLGAGPLRTFWYVTLPNIRSTLIGSSLIAFTLSFDEIPVTFFLTGRDNTLPMYIWSTVRRGITPEINAIGSIIIAASICLLLIAVFIMRGEDRRSRARGGR